MLASFFINRKYLLVNHLSDSKKEFIKYFYILDMSSFKSRFYFLRVNNSHGNQNFKILKNNKYSCFLIIPLEIIIHLNYSF